MSQQDIHDLITEYEHSIAGAKIDASPLPPPGRVLSSEDEQRCTIPVRNSFATVCELDRREHRCDSLLNRGSFLLTSEPDILGMTEESLEKFKAGLQYAFRLADSLADLATYFTVLGGPQPPTSLAPNGLAPFPLTDNTVLPTSSPSRSRPSNDAVRQQYLAATALRHAQIHYLRQLPSRGLAWLVTLAMGASKGYARYSAKLLQTDPALADARVMAFKEVLLRHGGSLLVWGFMRGTGTLAQFVKTAVAQCAEEVLFFEVNGQAAAGLWQHQHDGAADDLGNGVVDAEPAGLHMTIMQELNRRIQRIKKFEAEEKGEVWDGEEVGPLEVWEEVNKLVAQEVGCGGWRGYHAIKYPVRDTEAQAEA